MAISAAVCFLPRSTSINQTVTAAKLDQSGNETGTVEITIYGRKLDYLFQDPRLSLSFDPFDHYSWVEAADVVNEPEGFISIYPGTDFWCASYAAGNEVTDNIDDFLLFFSPDLGRWAMVDYHNENRYVFSTSGDYSTQELFEYFKILFP